MSDMELYDPEFPCDTDLQDRADAAANQDANQETDISAVDTATHDECSEIQLSSIELPPEPYRPMELFKNTETINSTHKERQECGAGDCSKITDGPDHPKKSSSLTEISFDKIEDADGDDAIEDDARYRDELKKLTAVRQTNKLESKAAKDLRQTKDLDSKSAKDPRQVKDLDSKSVKELRQTKELESKSAKDVPLEIYLGPSVGFRVDLTMSKSRKLNVESIAKKRHDDMFERLSPERRVKARSDATSGGTKADSKSLSKTPAGKSEVPTESPGEVSRPKKSGPNEPRSVPVELEDDPDRDLRLLLRKREAEHQALMAVPRVVKMKHADRKSEDNPGDRLDEAPASRKLRLQEENRDNAEFCSRKRVDFGSETKRSRHRAYEAEVEIEHVDRRDGSSSKKSNAREKEREPREKDTKRANSSKYVRDEYEPRRRSEERLKGGKNENKELSSGTNKSRDWERLPESDTDPDHRSRRKRHNSRSTSTEHKKKARKSKSRSPKRKRDRSRSVDRRRTTKDGRSRSREPEKRQEKKSETKSKTNDRHPTPTRDRRDERHRHHKSRSKSPVKEPESKKSKRSRHSDLTESNYYDDQWAYDDERSHSKSARNKSKQPSLRELQERSTSLLEACMKTRYENQGSGDDRRRAHRHRHHDKKRDFVQSINFGRISGKPGSVDYITLSDSDEGIVWSDNDEGYGNYSHLPVRNESSKKQKYEDIYSGRSLPCVENRLPSRSPSPPPSKSRSKKVSSLSPSQIIAINMKRKENFKKLEKLKITKSVSRSSLEPGEIDDRSSVDLSDNGMIEEDTEPTRRMVSIVNEGEGNRRQGDKVPIQIHVITSHGDGRDHGKADEIMTDCDENVLGFVTTTDDAVGTAERGKRRTDAHPSHEEEEEMCAEEHDSDDKELPGDLVICTGTSPANLETREMHTKAERDGLDLVYDTQSRGAQFERPMVAEDFKKGVAVAAMNSDRQMSSATSVGDQKSKDIFDFVSRKDESSGGNLRTETIPGLGDAFPSPVKESDIDLPPVGARNLSSFYHIKKKSQLEQTSLQLDLNVEPIALTAPSPQLTSPHKTLFPKDDPVYSSPRKSPIHESIGTASHPTLPQIVSKTPAASGRAPEAALTVDPELSSDRPPSSKAGIPMPSTLSNAFLLNQNTIVDLLTSFPSSSASLVPPSSSSVAASSHDDNPISKLLAAFNPMLATLGTTANSQKLIDDIVKSSSSVTDSSPQFSIDSKSGSGADDRLTNIFNMQKKLLELTRISAATPQPAAPISQKLVQDIFKAVLVPTTSSSKSSLNLSARAADLPGSFSEENSLSPTSPFNVDAASPLSGEIMSFSPPSIPDTSSPVRKVEKTTAAESKSQQKTKSKDGKTGKSKPEDDLMDKKSKSDVQKVVVEEVKSIIRPFYSKGRINKDEYKEIMRKTVPSICQSKTQDFSKTRITIYVEAYVRKVQATRKYHAKKKDK